MPNQRRAPGARCACARAHARRVASAPLFVVTRAHYAAMSTCVAAICAQRAARYIRYARRYASAPRAYEPARRERQQRDDDIRRAMRETCAWRARSATRGDARAATPRRARASIERRCRARTASDAVKMREIGARARTRIRRYLLLPLQERYSI